MKKIQAGFNLIELLVVIAIVGVLAALAYPSYRQYVLKSKRAEGRDALMNAVVRQERWYFQFNQYVIADGANTNADALGLGLSPSGLFDIETTGCTGVSVTTDGKSSCFVAVATAQGAQIEDSQCFKLKVSSNGLKTSEDSSGGASTDCWD